MTLWTVRQIIGVLEHFIQRGNKWGLKTSKLGISRHLST